MIPVRIIPLTPNLRLPLERLREDLEEKLHTPVGLFDLRLDVGATFDASRRQYHSTLLLSMLLGASPEDGSKLLGVAAFDLFVPVLTFVFGQAQVNNRAAVFSTFRLQNEYYGLPHDPRVLYERALKEALHELGHTYGLRHCAEYPCTMNASTYVEDIDLKPADYCPLCLDSLNATK